MLVILLALVQIGVIMQQTLVTMHVPVLINLGILQIIAFAKTVWLLVSLAHKQLHLIVLLVIMANIYTKVFVIQHVLVQHGVIMELKPVITHVLVLTNLEI